MIKSIYNSVENRINESKLIFLQYLINQEESNLSKEIYLIQKSLNFPGFVSETRKLIDQYKLPNIIDGKSMSKLKWRTTVKAAIKTTYEKELKDKMTTSKFKDGPMLDEMFVKKDYIKSMKLSDARTNFRLRSKTTNVKMNRKSNPAMQPSSGNVKHVATSTPSATSCGAWCSHHSGMART